MFCLSLPFFPETACLRHEKAGIEDAKVMEKPVDISELREWVLKAGVNTSASLSRMNLMGAELPFQS